MRSKLNKFGSKRENVFNSSNVWTPTNARWIVNTNVLHSASLSILALTKASCDTRRHFSLIRIVTLLNRCHRETNTGWYKYGHGEQMDILGWYYCIGMQVTGIDWNVTGYEKKKSPTSRLRRHQPLPDRLLRSGQFRAHGSCMLWDEPKAPRVLERFGKQENMV